jgi:hypothetical protein
MLDGLIEQASQAMDIAESHGAYNIRFTASCRWSVEFDYRIEWLVDDVFSYLSCVNQPEALCSELRLRLPSTNMCMRQYRAKVGEQPVWLKYGEDKLDLLEDDSVVYVVVQSEHEANLSRLLEEHPEWTGRVQVIVLKFSQSKIYDDWVYTASFEVHGVGAPKQGETIDGDQTWHELHERDFYILNHKVVWKGKVPDRDVAADINSLLAGNQLVVPTELATEVKLPAKEDVRNKLLQVQSLFEALSRTEEGRPRIKPKLSFQGIKTLSKTFPTVEKFRYEIFLTSRQGGPGEIDEYFALIEAVKEIIPCVKSR